MICEHCNVEIPDDMRFCPVCGTDVVAEAEEKARAAEEAAIAAERAAAMKARAEKAKEDAAAQEQVPASEEDQQTVTLLPEETQQGAQEGMQEDANPPKKPVNKKKLAIIGASVLAVAICAVLIPLLIHNARQTNYNNGVTLLEQGDYAGAQAIFEKLGSFDDSADLALYCRNQQTYLDAKEQMRKGDYQSAQEAFAGLGDFEDSADQAQFCANTLAYNAAEALMEAGDYQAAADAFLELGSFQDASEQAQFCENTLLYSEAEALFEQGEYEAAQPLYEQLLDADFSDAADKYDYCVNMEAYIEALTLLELEQYYDAYCALEELNGFLDSYSDMADCIQPFPETGETYHNDAYASRACSLTINPPTSDGSRNYIKVYAENGDLVSCVSIGKGESATIWLPAGSYQIKTAYGYGEWFGETDLFGDDGYYYILENSADDSQYFTLKSRYEYTLSLRTGSTGGDSVGTEKEDREYF